MQLKRGHRLGRDWWSMKTTQSPGTRSDHQPVAPKLEFKTDGQAIAIEFTDQALSPPAGSATFWGWLRPLDWTRRLAAAMPQPLPRSNNRLMPVEKALAFMHGLLCDARKLTQVAYLRRDPLAPELLGIKRIASQSVLSRFFQGFGSAGDNLRSFRPLWHWCLDRLPTSKAGYTLALDSTRLLPCDGQQEGVRSGYTRQGVKPCLHPLLAVLAEVRLVAQLWLRPGNTACGNHAAAFFLDLWQNLPRHVRLQGGAGRLGPLPARTAGSVGATAAALCGGRPAEPADPEAAPERPGVGGDRGAGDGSGGVGTPGPELAASAAAGVDPAPGGRGRKPGRQAAPGRAGPPVPGSW